ncbi:uncharacterized protein LOC142563847 [Dermacentor variabilis]|uniref:uncharacterized protein LOC142563847 n=1 Tax=Dermacentor variabilis TaxID=34621 RepID=UPI003F5BCB7D
MSTQTTSHVHLRTNMQNLYFLALSAVTLSLLLVGMANFTGPDCTPRNKGGLCYVPDACNCSMPLYDPHGQEYFTYNKSTNSCIPIRTLNTTSCNLFDSLKQCNYHCAGGEEYPDDETPASNGEFEKDDHDEE